MVEVRCTGQPTRVACPSRVPPQLVERSTDRGPVEPTRSSVTVRPRFPPELEKDLDSQFLRPGRVAHDSGDDPRDASVVCREDGLEIERNLDGGRFVPASGGFMSDAHTYTTLADAEL